MTRWMVFGGATAVFLGIAGLAQADVTGAEVWENWKSAARGMGQVFNPGSVTKAGDTLTIRDLQFSMTAPEVDVSWTIAMVEFRDRDDGTVAIAFSPGFLMTIRAEPAGEQPVDIAIGITQAGLVMVASGSDDKIAYDFLVPEAVADLISVTADGKPVDASARATMAGMNGNYTVTGGDTPVVSSRLNARGFSFDVAATGPGDGGGAFTMNFEMADLHSESSASMTPTIALDNLSAMLAGGFGVSGTFGHGAASYTMGFADGSGTFNLDGSVDSGALAMVLNNRELGYEVSNTGLSIVLSGSDIPLPEVAVELARIGFGFLMPTTAGDTPGAFKFSIILGGLSVSDTIWDIIDTTGGLPHDPATLIVDLSGNMNWLVDIFDPEVADSMGDKVPAELHDMALNDLTLDVVGVMLTGNGGFTFDNPDPETFGGLPAPTGAIDLKLVGGNTLLDALVAMGLLPEDQAMVARVTMGLFARPGDGEDTLVSKIEIDGATGAISANGQRLQ